jgi:hypothetical protein
VEDLRKKFTFALGCTFRGRHLVFGRDVGSLQYQVLMTSLTKPDCLNKKRFVKKGITSLYKICILVSKNAANNAL